MPPTTRLGAAISWEGEDGTVRELTNAELAADVEAAARRLTELGVAPGDRVGILLPMLPETVVAVLAVARLGAIFTPIFSGYAAPAIAARLVDCEATLLITADGFLRRGAWVDLKSRRRRGRRSRAVRQAGDRRPARRRGARRALDGGAGRVVGHAVGTGRRSRTARRSSAGTPRRRT